MKAYSTFEVIAPDGPETDGPVMALAPDLCYRGDDGTVPVVELPTEVDGIKLYAGVILFGSGQIFKERAEDVKPRELQVIAVPERSS